MVNIWKQKLNCACDESHVMLIQYGHNTPREYLYDGISEINCLKCGKRVGRWTGKELLEGELEPRYGNE